MSEAPRACPSCAGTAATRLDAYSPDGWDVVRCDACAFVYLRNPPPYEALEEDFAWEKTYEAKKEKGGSTSFSATNRALRQKLRIRPGRRSERAYTRAFGSGRVLDVGCGDGARIGAPMVPYGIELSRALWAEADARMRDRGGYCLHAAGAEGIWQFDEGFFDGIVMFSYLEHEANVARVLDGAFRALKPGGAVFVRVPNFGSVNRRVIGPKWCGFRYPDHVNYFTLSSLRQVAARAGFETRLVNRLNLWFDDNIQVLLTKRPAA
ncbi:MAG: hypothetical protein RLZZ528_1422 [Pseudomonadota bacterium]